MLRTKLGKQTDDHGSESTDQQVSRVSMMATSCCDGDGSFFLETGATQHTFGNPDSFIYIMPHVETIKTAKVCVSSSHKGAVELRLESGTLLRLMSVIFYKLHRIY